MSQREKIIDMLKTQGYVSRNYCINNRISIRLGAIIHNLKKDGWVLTGEKSNNDFIYWLEKSPQLKLL